MAFDPRPLLAGVPSRRRVLAEVAFVLTLTFGGDLPWPWLGAIALLIAGGALVGPWRIGSTTIARAGATLALVVAIVMPVALAEAMHGAMAGARRIGVSISAVEPRPEDPAVAGGLVEVTEIKPGTAADGFLAVGDRIATVDGAPLDRASPSRNLVALLQKTRDTATLEVIRDHRLEARAVPVPRSARASGPAAWRAIGGFARDHVLAGAVVRALCVMGFVLLLLRSDRQTVAVLGLTSRDVLPDGLVGLTLTFGAFATALVAGMLFRGVAQVAHSTLVEREAVDRPALLLDLFGGTSLLTFAAAIAVTATFEEVVFRGFLLARLQHLTRSWPAAVALGAIAFSAGHVYEGWTAVGQTAALGVFFGVVFLLRGRLVPVIVAHASFDVAVLGLLTWLQQSGMLEKGRQMLEQKP